MRIATFCIAICSLLIALASCIWLGIEHSQLSRLADTDKSLRRQIVAAQGKAPDAVFAGEWLCEHGSDAASVGLPEKLAFRGDGSLSGRFESVAPADAAVNAPAATSTDGQAGTDAVPNGGDAGAAGTGGRVKSSYLERIGGRTGAGAPGGHPEPESDNRFGGAAGAGIPTYRTEKHYLRGKWHPDAHGSIIYVEWDPEESQSAGQPSSFVLAYIPDMDCLISTTTKAKYYRGDSSNASHEPTQ